MRENVRIFVKTFLASKVGDVKYSQDQLRTNYRKGLFAVADGVTKSYHPELTAKAVCNAFVRGDVPIEQWPQHFRENILGKIAKTWRRGVLEYEKTLSSRRLAQAHAVREFLPAGASTLAGIAINSERQTIHYQIMGDSTLFIFNKEGDFKTFCTNKREERNGRSFVIYDNHPQCFVADGQIFGRWLYGEELLPSDGFVALLTDAASDWLQEKAANGLDAIQQLWDIKDAQDFDSFVNKCREKDMKMEDDVAIIILKCEGVSHAKKIKYINMLSPKR